MSSLFSSIREWWYSLLGYFYVKYADREKPKVIKACQDCKYYHSVSHAVDKRCGALGGANALDVRNSYIKAGNSDCPYFNPKQVGLIRWLWRKLF